MVKKCRTGIFKLFVLIAFCAGDWKRVLTSVTGIAEMCIKWPGVNSVTRPLYRIRNLASIYRLEHCDVSCVINDPQ